jgi:predicted mannosyl-3-phosphoglycerate phosphatase (HAD superfamily)
MTKTITAKELRSKFPWVQEQLALGVTFVVICRSKPVAEMRPYNESLHSESGMSALEYSGWLKNTESSLNFWNHPSNDAYEQLLNQK